MTAQAAAKLLGQVATIALIVGTSPALAQQKQASTTQQAESVLTGKAPPKTAGKAGEEAERQVISGAGGAPGG